MKALNSCNFVLLFLFQLAESQSINLLNVNVQYRRTVSASNLEDRTAFRLSGRLGNGVSVNDAWLGIGLNDRSQMGGAHVFVCRNSANTKWIRHYFTNFYFLALRDESNPTLGLLDSQVSVNSSNLTCTFTVDNRVLTQVNFAEPFFILAYGSGNPSYHGSNKVVSPGKVSIQAIVASTTAPSSTARTSSTSRLESITPASTTLASSSSRLESTTPSPTTIASSSSQLRSTAAASSTKSWAFTSLSTSDDSRSSTVLFESSSGSTSTANITPQSQTYIPVTAQTSSPFIDFDSLINYFQVQYQLFISCLNQLGLNLKKN